MRAIGRIGFLGASLYVTMLLCSAWAAAQDHVRFSAPRVLPSTSGAPPERTDRCRVIADGRQVCPLPDDNLIVNPWFRTGTKPSLDGWTVFRAPSGGWEPSQKPGNPTPDETVGTAARISTGRGADRTGRTIDPGAFTSLVQVVPADPDQRVLKFSMYWVAHTVDPIIVTIDVGAGPDGPWTTVWTPFYQRFTQVIRPESGRGNDLWRYYSGLTPPVRMTLDHGYPFYKIAITARLPDEHGGLKITGVYFATEGAP